ncbi:MAG: nucleotidyl transferase AbiEii/AbiGii toxin family protein [Bacteroidia bacterium]
MKNTNMPEQYYINQLYPLQDKILSILAQKGLSFYLTGGTALSLYFLHHRYSDELDFFLNNSPAFRKETSLAVEVIKQNFNEVEIAITDDNFLWLFLVDNNTTLKVEFINDFSFRAGEIINTQLYYRTDNKENIHRSFRSSKI